MKNGTKWIGIGLAVLCAGWATKASALMTWWGPLPPEYQSELPAVGENTLDECNTMGISAAKMAEIQQAIQNSQPPVGEATGCPSNTYLHVWPVGAVGPTRIIYVPVSGPATGGVTTVTRTTSISPVGERVVLSPVGERVTTTHVIRRHRIRRFRRVVYTSY